MRFLSIIALLLTSITARAQWTIEDSHTTADLRGIANAGGGIAWASGTNGTVLRTTDGGTTWQTCAIPPGAEKLDFRGIQAFDANTAIVMSSGPGDQSRLYKTTDGCATWKLVFTNPDKDGFWDAIQVTEFTGLLIGDPVQNKFSLFRTQDGGSTWTRWGTKPYPDKYALEWPVRSAKNQTIFAASNEAMWTVDSGAFVFVTGGASGARLMVQIRDGDAEEMGVRWPIQSVSTKLPLKTGSQSGGAFAVAPKNRTRWSLKLMVVGGDYEHPDDTTDTAVYLSSKEGQHVPFTSYFDVTQPTIPPHGYRSAVAYDERSKTWITVGPNGTDISTDDGRNWRALKPTATDAPDADKNWNALSLPFVVGPKGRIGKLNADLSK